MSTCGEFINIQEIKKHTPKKPIGQKERGLHNNLRRKKLKTLHTKTYGMQLKQSPEEKKNRSCKHLYFRKKDLNNLVFHLKKLKRIPT